jgi:hypothetical protein
VLDTSPGQRRVILPDGTAGTATFHDLSGMPNDGPTASVLADSGKQYEFPSSEVHRLQPEVSAAHTAETAGNAAYGAPVAAEPVIAPSLGDLMRSSERAKPIRDLLARLRDPEGVKIEAKAAETAAPAAEEVAQKALKPKEWLADTFNKLKRGEIADHAVPLKIGGRTAQVPLSKVLAAAKNESGSKEAVAAAQQALAAMHKKYLAEFETKAAGASGVDDALREGFQQEQNFVDVNKLDEATFDHLLDNDLIREIEYKDGTGSGTWTLTGEGMKRGEQLANPAAAATDGPAVTTLNNSLERFNHLRKTHEEMVTQVLGSKLVDQFARTTNPENFDRTIASLSKLLDDMGTLDDLDLAALPNKSAVLNLMKQLKVAGSEKDLLATQAAHAALQRTPETTKAQIEAMGKELDPATGKVDPSTAQVAKVMPSFLKDNFGKEYLEATYPHRTATDVARTEEELGKGLGRDVDAVNTHAQYDLWQRIHLPLRKSFETLNKGRDKIKQAYYEKRFAAVAERTMKGIREAEAYLEKNGVPLHIDYDGVRYPLKFSELYDNVAAKDKWLADVLFHSEFATAPTLYAEAAVLAMRSRGDEEALQAIFDKLTSVAKRNGKSGDIPNWLTPLKNGEPRWGRVAHLPGQKKPPAGFKGFSAAAGEVRFIPNDSKTGFYVELSNDALAGRTFGHLIDSAIELASKATENADAYAKRFGEDIYMVTDKVIADIQKLADDPDSIGAAITALAKKDEVVNEAASTVHARHDATEVARMQVDATLPPESVTTATTTQRIAEAVGRGDQAAVITARAEHTADSAKETQELIDEVGPHIEEVDLSDPLKALTENVAVTINGTRARLLDPIRKSFHASHGMTVPGKVDLFQWMRSSGQLTSDYLRENVGLINALPKKYPGVVNGTPVITWPSSA